MRTLNYEYEGMQFSLCRPTVADSRVRVALTKALIDGTDQTRIDGLQNIWCYYITMVNKAEGTDDKKITVCPSPDEAKAAYARWESETDEFLSGIHIEKINQLIARPKETDSDQKKQLEP